MASNRQLSTLSSQLQSWLAYHVRQQFHLDDVREAFPEADASTEHSIRTFMGQFADEQSPNYLEGFARIGRGRYMYDPPLTPMELYLLREQPWDTPYRHGARFKRQHRKDRRHHQRLPDDLRRALYEAQERLCPICGRTAERIFDVAHIDHITAVVHEGTAGPPNIQLTHPACNILKGATRTMQEVWDGAEAAIQADGRPLLEPRLRPRAQWAHKSALAWNDRYVQGLQA